MQDIAIIGESPGPNSEGALLESRSCERLAQLLELDYIEELTTLARMITLLGFNPDGSFPLRICTLVARSLELSETNVFLGYQVAACFGLNADHELLTWYVLPGGEEVAIFPHPSGKNRWWNDPQNVAEAKGFLCDLFYADDEEEEDEQEHQRMA